MANRLEVQKGEVIYSDGENFFPMLHSTGTYNSLECFYHTHWMQRFFLPINGAIGAMLYVFKQRGVFTWFFLRVDESITSIENILNAKQ